ncbi:MAG: hypothetical protein LBH44_01090 [Treponema sp.]|jgi:hypothetical protein|nr:hypothetical protein [Treponema sp.]
MKTITKIFALVLALCLAGCATYVPIKSVRPPTIDTSNIQRLAVKPFEDKSGVGGSVGAQLTQYMTDKAMQLITAAGKFTIVAPTDPNADGVFTGEIRSIVSTDSKASKEKTDKEGNTYTQITYSRDVSLTFMYNIISTRTDMPVGTVNKQGSNGASSTESAAAVTDTLTLAKRIVDSQMRTLQQDIVPTIVSTSRRLMNETSKDKDLKQRMKTALALVKNNNYEEAIRQFDEISGEYGSVAAMTNAGILRESIASDIAARDRLAQLFSDTSGLADKAVRNANNALNSKLPLGANITIMKTSAAEHNMLDYVVEQLTKIVVQAGKLQVVDRFNQSLIDAEQQFQLTGNVSDDTAVSIGHQLGVKYMVLCWISGEKSLRRFNLKVLNVETAQITDLTDFEI